jgi:hypothetical protein
LPIIISDFRIPTKLAVSAWSTDLTCDGPVYLTYPVHITNSSCNSNLVIKQRSSSSADLNSENSSSYSPLNGRTLRYHALVCASNRTEWCQREYKNHVIWPRTIGQNCAIRRTGVDKSRCYLAGKLEIEYELTCGLLSGEKIVNPLIYHMLQDDREARTHARSRVRRALNLKPPFFKRPLYVVNIKVRY